MKDIDLSHTALLIVDVQNDFCPGGALAVPQGNEIIPIINSISRDFPVVAATRDWHPANHVSFASSHPGKNLYDMVNAGGIDQLLWPDHCIQSSEGADFHNDLDIAPVNLIVHKGTSVPLDSYSAFFDNDHSSSTGLEGALKGLGIKKIYLCGLATDYCVYYSAMDAVKLGFETFLLTDAVRGVNIPEGSVESALQAMEKAGISMVTL